MKKALIILFLLVGLAACDQQLDPAPEANAEQILSATENATENLVTERGDRIFPVEGIRATASGPATLPEGTMRSAIGENAVASIIGFNPNAGAIWKDPGTGLTHLMALQLPGGSPKAIKWESLGTGWQGAEFITMDRENFYVVWNNEVYKNPKGVPNAWTLIVPNNGEDIKGVKGFQSNNSTVKGFYLVRGNCMNSVDTSGNFISLYGCNDAFAFNKCMAYFRDTSFGGFNFLFREFSDKTWHFSNPEGVSTWNSLSNLQQAGMFEMVGNPMSNRFYKSFKLGNMIINEINPAGEGSEIDFCTLDYVPSTSSLVVNNGYVWIMSNTLHRIITFGPHRGKSAYTEGGWFGMQMACADPTLVFSE